MTRGESRRGAAAIWRQTGLLLLAALLAATAAWALRTPRWPLRAEPALYAQEWAAPLITAGTALQLYHEGKHHFVDTRQLELPQAPHIPGAFSIRPTSFADDLLAASDFMFPSDAFVLYGTDDLAPVSSVAARFQERGYPDVEIMVGGLEAWRTAGGPVSGEATRE
jgi:3-mercaptopyruvate sulfurtransferase SseA